MKNGGTKSEDTVLARNQSLSRNTSTSLFKRKQGAGCGSESLNPVTQEVEAGRYW